ncbi:DUF1572 domain-containing protein [Leptobacterium sp. I13]|uniref:DUF1572 domain-containing protein n=1 Tax=Leptobacterium meishanense TaxID=3128904 RepID=UPI0030EBDC2F
MMHENYLDSALKLFQYYKSLGNKTLALLTDDNIHWQSSEENNSIAIIVKHIAGNMLSRWTNFLTEDGEKEWRNRDDEFEDTYASKEEMMAHWEQGWNCLFSALNSLNPEDFDKIIYIRNQGHTVVEAINRQLAHYPYHIGQLIYIAKILKGNNWQSLSVPKGQSENYNTGKFSQKKERKHFTDEYINPSEK